MVFQSVITFIIFLFFFPDKKSKNDNTRWIIYVSSQVKVRDRSGIFLTNSLSFVIYYVQSEQINDGVGWIKLHNLHCIDLHQKYAHTLWYIY